MSTKHGPSRLLMTLIWAAVMLKIPQLTQKTIIRIFASFSVIVIAVIALILLNEIAPTSANSAAKFLKNESEVLLDGRVYEKNELIDEFLNIAIGKYEGAWVATDDNQLANSSKFHRYVPSDKSKWVYELVRRDDGKPNHEAIVKWNTDITVATQWPPGDYDEYPHEFPFDTSQSYNADIEKLIENQVSLLSKSIEDATGLSVSFLGKKAETKENFGKLRIVYRRQMCIHSNHNVFKADGCHSGGIGQVSGKLSHTFELFAGNN